VDAQQIWAVNQMYNVVRHPKIVQEEDSVKNILHFLMLHGIFQIPEQSPKGLSKLGVKEWIPATPVSHAVRDVCNQRFFGVLGELNSFVPGMRYYYLVRAIMIVLVQLARSKRKV
jgi:hypothetical protein